MAIEVSCHVLGAAAGVLSLGGVHGERHRADQRRLVRELGQHELRWERGAGAQRPLQVRLQPGPRASHATADRDPCRVNADCQVNQVKR